MSNRKKTTTAERKNASGLVPLKKIIKNAFKIAAC